MRGPRPQHIRELSAQLWHGRQVLKYNVRVGEQAASGNGGPARGLQAATARRGEGVHHGVWDGWVSGGSGDAPARDAH